MSRGCAPMPPRLFEDPAWSVKPEMGRTEPRLWVRRVAILREPGQFIRDVQLKRGLNVVWSPDGGTADEPMGHGGGKTTFCRLLRYCLGEDSFAPEGQRRAIQSHFPAGSVGAEILLNGTPWAIVRSLGDRRRDIALENATLEDSLQAEVSPTGMRPFREAVADAIIADAAALMPSSVGDQDAWEATLAWATRDQECRFGDHLEWRDPHSDSHSPVRGISSADILLIVRALIGALSADEITAQQRAAEQSKLLASHRSKSERLAWQIERSHEELAAAFSLTDFGPGTPLACEGFKAAAVAALSKLFDLPADSTTTDLQTARSQHQRAQQELQRIKAEYEGVAIRIEEREKTTSYMQSELPEAHARLTKGNNPICPICEVPIDTALAQGCGISTATCDLEALQTRVAKLREQIQNRQREIAQLKSERAKLKASLESARERVEPAARTLAALERNIYQRSTAIREAQRLVDDAERYERLTQERSAEAGAADSVSGQLEATRETLSAHRIAVAESITYLSGWFDTTMRELVPGEIRATAKLDGNGLTLKVELGGDRSTAAIDSLKVVAFDLAVLIMSIEGRTRFPGFLIHDSPREADLGLSIYSRLFAFARTLESFGPSPLFQYIVTTTTEPPPEFRTDNWLRLTVHGAPASERLLKVDL
jgi:peptidoglycan hydrolase CwlO-like protein